MLPRSRGRCSTRDATPPQVPYTTTATLNDYRAPDNSIPTNQAILAGTDQVLPRLAYNLHPVNRTLTSPSHTIAQNGAPVISSSSNRTPAAPSHSHQGFDANYHESPHKSQPFLAQLPGRSEGGESLSALQLSAPDLSPGDPLRTLNPLKRTFNVSPSTDRTSNRHLSRTKTTNEISDSRSIPPSSGTSLRSDASTPITVAPSFTRAMPMTQSTEQLDKLANTNIRRCSLHLRQQPRAARAGPDGKDRRAIDPPPILQLLMNDFNSDVSDDVAEIQSTFWVCHCRLVSPESPKKDMSIMSSSTGNGGSREIQRLLLGTTVASPFQCTEDPDPETMVSHPIAREPISRPPSPSARFLPGPLSRTQEKQKEKPPTNPRVPCAFFIFADLSVRKAGDYRLEFSLMKVEANVLQTGSTLPITHSVTSQVFRVVNAKDFDQVQPSTNLVKGLLDRGAGFPLKLKKGTREGQRRKDAGGGSDAEDESNEEDEGDDG